MPGYRRERRARYVRRRALALALLAALVGVVVVVAASGGHSSRSTRGNSGTSKRSAAVDGGDVHKSTVESGGSRRAGARRRAGSLKARAAGTPKTLAGMLGQMIVARFSGPDPSAGLLERIRRGEVGGVILFADNVAGGEAATRELISSLQRAAGEGGNPPLLVMTDQEGGEVRRLPWAPPTLAPSAMSSTAVALAQGRATGGALRAVGINVDLAPVADVERVADSFLGTRAFGSEAAPVAADACAFAEGLAAEGVAFTLKHFPGLGRATTSTDVHSTTVPAPAAALREDYGAYNQCGRSPRGLVMVSSAIYPSLTGGSLPAVLSPEIYSEELPLAVGIPGVLTISDDLQAPALAGETNVARRAVDAGLDLLMYATSEAGSSAAYSELLAASASGAVPRERIEAASGAIDALKEAIG
jgi:beta-N-acetylhexosaminidase